MKFLVSLITAFITGSLVSMLAYSIVCLASPPVFIDSITGERHPVMPMGQAFLGIGAGILSGLAALIITWRNYGRIIAWLWPR